jgi:hypothetical protein
MGHQRECADAFAELRSDFGYPEEEPHLTYTRLIADVQRMAYCLLNGVEPPHDIEKRAGMLLEVPIDTNPDWPELARVRETLAATLEAKPDPGAELTKLAQARSHIQALTKQPPGTDWPTLFREIHRVFSEPRQTSKKG